MTRRVDPHGGERLAFLCSMPRSGSTMLSMMLGAHSAVLSPPEPWFLLPLADLLGIGELRAVPYGEESALLGSVKYLDRIVAAGEGAWLGSKAGEAARARIAGTAPEAILREFAASVYAKDLRLSRKRLFLDKTPRYYRILPILDRVFPRAKKIYLARNPLDVASSYKATWGISVGELCGDVATANSYDFCRGLFDLEQYFAARAATKLVVSYESLVKRPQAELGRICKFLGLRFEPAMLRYHANARLVHEHRDAVVGDPRTNRNPGPVDANSVGRWRELLSAGEKQQLAAALGGDIFKRLGYANVLTELKADGIRVPTAKAAAAHREVVVAHLVSGKGAAADRLGALIHLVSGLLSERGTQAANIDRLAAEASALKEDQGAKAQVIERLTAQFTAREQRHHDTAAAASALKEDQNAKAQVIERLTAQLAELERGRGEDAAVIARMSGEIESVTADRAELLARAERLVAESAALVEDQGAKAKVIERLTAQLAELERVRGEGAAAIARMSGEIESVTADRAELLARAERLVAESAALVEDQGAKVTVIERLTTQLEELERGRGEGAAAVARMSGEIESVTADRAELLARAERLVAEMSAVQQDQGAKSQVIARLTAAVAGLEQDGRDAAATNARLSAELANLGTRRATAQADNERLVAEAVALKQAQSEKGQVIGRLSAELESSREEQSADRRLAQEERQAVQAERLAAQAALDRLADEKAALEQDRRARSETIVSLVQTLARARAEHRAARESAGRLASKAAIRADKLAAKDQVLRASAVRELERKALLGGAPDLLWYRQRNLRQYAWGRRIEGGQAQGELHVAVDTLQIVFGVSGGVETYMTMLVGALIGAGHRVTLICMPDQLAALQAQFDGRAAYFVVNASRAMELSAAVARRRGKQGRLTAEQTLLTFSRLAEDLDAHLLHSPVQIFSALDFRLPAVLNLHDLQHLHFPENFRPSDIEARNHLYGLSAALADAIIVSSDFVRNDLVERMGVAPQKVFTVPVTWDPLVEQGLARFSAAQARAHYRLPPNYALYPAQFWAHKNHARLVEALKIVRDRAPEADLKLVLTGFRGHAGWPKVEETVHRLGLEGEVLCLDYVPVGHLAGLYKAAAFCVVPSTFEASSYPVIEAQMLGVPAMCSAVTSLPELMCDGAGLLFDPLDVEDIAAKMLRWVEDPADAAAHAQRAVIKVRTDHGIDRYVAGIGGVYQYALHYGD